MGHDPSRVYATWRPAADNKTVLYDKRSDPVLAQATVLAPIAMYERISF